MGASQTNLQKKTVVLSASPDSQAHRQIPKRIARFPSASSDSQAHRQIPPAGLQSLYGHRQSTLELEICGCLLRRQVTSDDFLCEIFLYQKTIETNTVGYGLFEVM